MGNGGNGGGGYGLGESDVFSDSLRGSYTDVYGEQSYTIGGAGAPEGYGDPGYTGDSSTGYEGSYLDAGLESGMGIPASDLSIDPSGEVLADFKGSFDWNLAGEVGTAASILGPGPGALAGFLAGMSGYFPGIEPGEYAGELSAANAQYGSDGSEGLPVPRTTPGPIVPGTPPPAGDGDGDDLEPDPEEILETGEKAARRQSRQRFGRLAARITNPNKLGNPLIYIPTLR